MFYLNFRDSRPIYEQIKEKLRQLIISDALQADAPIPSVRELAQSLTVNPNTIQKAYRDLEAEGYIYSVKGKGSFVAPQDKNGANYTVRIESLIKSFEQTLTELVFIGVPKERLQQLLDSTFEKKQEVLGNET